MNKQEVYEFLKAKGIWHEITEHEAVYNMEELEKVELPYPEADAKNIFVRDDKRKNYYLITVKSNKRVNLKEFKKQNMTRQLTFASEEDLKLVMGLFPGAVTPFGVLNDAEKKVQVFIDEDFLENPGIMGVHPNDNTATVWIKTNDLINIIKEHGNNVKTFKVIEK